MLRSLRDRDAAFVLWSIFLLFESKNFAHRTNSRNLKPGRFGPKFPFPTVPSILTLILRLNRHFLDRIVGSPHPCRLVGLFWNLQFRQRGLWLQRHPTLQKLRGRHVAFWNVDGGLRMPVEARWRLR